MKIKTMINGCNFSEYQHLVVMTKGQLGIVPMGGGHPEDVSKKYGSYKIKHVSVYENIVRIEV